MFAINGIEIFHANIRIDDVRLTNAVTVEHNTLGPGVIGHIMRHRTIDPSTMAATDRWFHYDQVGSILCETNSSGTHAQRHDQDAFGNTLDTWQNGLIGGDQAGWHHNTKEYDAEVGLVYMYSRWYSSDVGLFTSSAPFSRMVEHPYSFGFSTPNDTFDPRGEKIEIRGPDEGLNVKMSECLGMLKTRGCGLDLRNMISELEDSPALHDVFIDPDGSALRRQGSYNRTNLANSTKDSAGNIRLGSFSYINANESNDWAPLCVIMVHELAHAMQNDTRYVRNGPANRAEREYEAVSYENLARLTLCAPIRKSYDHWEGGIP